METFNTIIKIIEVIIILYLGYLCTMKLIPKLFTLIMGKFGFKINPITQKRIARFKSIKRGYYSFVIIVTLLFLSLFLELMVNNKPLIIVYNGKVKFPAVVEWVSNVFFVKGLSSFNKKSDFGQIGEEEVDYRLFEKYSKNPELLKQEIEKRKKELGGKKDKDIEFLEKSYQNFKTKFHFIIMPIYPYSAYEHLLYLPGRPPHPPKPPHILGTDDSALDVIPQLLYGFRISLIFALFVTFVGNIIGVSIGAIMGYYGGWIDILIQRFIEIWSSIPFLFTIMIIASIIQPKFIILAILLIILRSWLGITYTIRGEFYREKAKDYVQAADSIGVPDWKIMFKHILPNALVPIVTYVPFEIVAYIGSLVSLDYLGFGLPIGTPSWGGLLRQGMQHIRDYPHLIIVPSTTFALTLFAVVMIGEAVREAFDPKVFSRLR